MKGFRRDPGWMRHLMSECVRSFWTGLVAFGALHLDGAVHCHPHRLHRPPDGHPEQLRPDEPLTELERFLVRELALRPWPHDPWPHDPWPHDPGPTGG